MTLVPMLADQPKLLDMDLKLHLPLRTPAIELALLLLPMLLWVSPLLLSLLLKPEKLYLGLSIWTCQSCSIANLWE